MDGLCEQQRQLHSVGALFGGFKSCSIRHRIPQWQAYWQDSQVGSSTPQNLMSVAALALSVICSGAAEDAASSKETGRAALGVADSDDTAFMRPELTVDFSAWVADIVRR